MSDQKELDVNNLEQEIAEFVKFKGYTAEFLAANEEVFQAGLIEYLQTKNYSLISILRTLKEYEEDKPKKRPKLPKKITKISEKLNSCDWPFQAFADTTTMVAGMVVYTVEKIAPNSQRPYVTYKPTPRIITQIHDSGVNGGTMFLTYEHKVMKPEQFSDKIQIVSEDEVFYSPLTYKHAQYVCKLLNAQSKNMYNKKLKELKELQKTK